MIKVIISDFSRTVLFPKVLTDTQEMNTINRNLIAESIGKDPQDLTVAELQSGALYYSAKDHYRLNNPLIDEFKRLKNQGTKSIQIFTSGYVQTHTELK